MSGKTVQTVKESFDSIYALLETAILRCPEDLWTKKAGGFYYWQQIVHVFGIIDAFVKEPDATPSQQEYDNDTIRLLTHSPHTPSRESVLAFAHTMRAAADAYFAAMDDSMLFQRNESRSRRKGMEVTELSAMINLVGHGYFHVGACDSMLREHGEKGLL